MDKEQWAIRVGKSDQWQMDGVRRSPHLLGGWGPNYLSPTYAPHRLELQQDVIVSWDEHRKHLEWMKCAAATLRYCDAGMCRACRRYSSVKILRSTIYNASTVPSA